VSRRADAAGPPRAALLVGGSSDIGAAVLAALARRGGCELVLAGRPSARRNAVAARLGATHHVHGLDWDASTATDPGALVAESMQMCGRPLDLVVVAVGALGGPLSDVGDPAGPAAVERDLTVNLLAPAGVVLAAAHHLAPRRGRLVVITSASAVRPRQGIGGYSVAKQALDQLTRMVARADGGGAHVHVVRPGHVRSAMTRGLPEPPLTRDPGQVAHDVVRGVAAGRTVIWSPPVMRFAMLALRSLPRRMLPPDLA
jgi:decaprenylphospho-beta-D-erythro-pentofuranosid-2-ulose 2-reductase